MDSMYPVGHWGYQPVDPLFQLRLEMEAVKKQNHDLIKRIIALEDKVATMQPTPWAWL